MSFRSILASCHQYLTDEFGISADMSKVTKAVVNVDADENTLGSNYQQILTKHRPVSPLFNPLIYTCYLQNLSLT